MRKRSILAIITGVWFLSIGLAQAYTLKDVLDASSQLAQITPSLLIAPCTGTAIKMDGKYYELRLVIFEQQGVGCAKGPTFKDFISKWNQLSVTPQRRSEALIPTDYFTATSEMKNKGFFYLVSLREVTDPDLLRKLKSR